MTPNINVPMRSTIPVHQACISLKKFFKNSFYLYIYLFIYLKAIKAFGDDVCKTEVNELWLLGDHKNELPRCTNRSEFITSDFPESPQKSVLFFLKQFS